MLTAVVVALGVLGAAALILRTARSGARLLLVLADATAARELAAVSARRGDITGMRERQALVRKLRRERVTETVLLCFWITLLVLPIGLGVVQWVYPAANLLWLLPPRSSHRRRVGSAP